MSRPAALSLLLFTALACGHKGDPLPPLRYEPRAADDLTVHQQGDVLILRFAYPRETISGGAVPGLASIEIWDMPLTGGAAQAAGVTDAVYARSARRLFALSGSELSSAIVGDRIEARVAVAPTTDGLDRGDHLLGVRTRSTSGETSTFSNRVEFSLARASAPPRELLLEAREDGILVTWQEPPATEGAPEPLGYLVYRREATERAWGPAIGVVTDDTSYLDRSAAFGTRYLYTVRAATSREPLVESSAAIDREILYRDRFPPDPPTRLLALPESGQVRIVLSASVAKDVAGYHVYRQDPGAAFRRITEVPLEQLELLDSGLTPGLSYTYRATAVDQSGNEGVSGDEVTITVPTGRR